jgi:hypothetical protein
MMPIKPQVLWFLPRGAHMDINWRKQLKLLKWTGGCGRTDSDKRKRRILQKNKEVQSLIRTTNVALTLESDGAALVRMRPQTATRMLITTPSAVSNWIGEEEADLAPRTL